MKITNWATQLFHTVPLQQEHTVDGDAIRSLTIDAHTADVELRSGTGSDLTAVLSGAVSESVYDGIHLDVLWEREDALAIRVRMDTKRMIGFNSLHLAVAIPDRLYETIRVHILTGDLEAQNLRAHSLDLTTNTGDLVVGSCQADTCLVRTITGEVEVKGQPRDLQVEATTGDVTIDADCQKLYARVVTGDINVRLKQTPESTSISCVTGDAYVHLATEPDALTINLATVIGSVHAQTATLGASNGKRRWSAASGSGGPQMTVHCTTGDIEFSSG